MKKSSENIAGFFHWTTQPNPLSINHIYSFRVVYIRKVKKSESKSQPAQSIGVDGLRVVYIRKVKKSESKSQRLLNSSINFSRLCISVKLKNLKANHN